MSEEQAENNAGEKCPLCDSPVERDGNNKSCANKGCPFWYWWPSDMAIDKVKLFRAENDALRAEVSRLTDVLEWYADEDNYDGYGAPYEFDENEQHERDNGQRARRALGRE